MIIPDIDTYAIYTEYDEKIKGGFASFKDAETYLDNYLPFHLINKKGELQGVAATQYEVTLALKYDPELVASRVNKDEYRILLECDVDEPPIEEEFRSIIHRQIVEQEAEAFADVVTADLDEELLEFPYAPVVPRLGIHSLLGEDVDI